ncbi:unnamed protein product [Closterium sp. NIES-65]|nr:unnamed protein product [Closterium sp. NIES-65]
MGLLPFPASVRPVFARVFLPLRMPCGFGAACGGSRGGQESGLLPSNPRRYKFSSGPNLLLPPYSIADIRVTCEALRARPYWNDNINVECYRAADESLPLSIDNDAAPLIGVAKLRLPVLFQDLGGPLSSSPSIFSSSSLSRAANTSMSGSASASARASIASGSVRADSASSSVLNSACDDFLDAARSVGEAQVKHRDEFISELGQALTDSKKQATALLHEVEELKWQLGQAQHQSKHLKSRVKDYEALGRGEGPGGVDERIEVLRTHLAEAEWNAEQAATDVWEKDKEIKDLKAKLASMELELQAMTEREEAVVALQERTEEKRAGLEEELAQVQEEMQRVARRKADLEADMRRRVMEAESAMAAAQAREKGLEERRRAAMVEERRLKARVLELKTEVARAGTHSTSSFKAVAQVAALRFQKERLLREKENLEKKLKEATGGAAGAAAAVAAVAGEASNETVQKLEQELAHMQEMLEAERSAAAEAAAQREAMRGEVEELRREVEALSARSKEEADGQQAEEQDPIASASEEELREQLQSALEQWEKTKNFSRLLQGQVFEQKKRIRELEGELKRSDAGPLKERLEKVEEEARALGQYVEQLERERAQGGADPAEVEAMRANLQAMREEVGQPPPLPAPSFPLSPSSSPLPFSAPSASPYSPLFPPAPPAPPPASPSPLFFYPLLSPSPLFYSIDPPLTGRGGSSRGGGDEGEPAGDARGGGAATPSACPSFPLSPSSSPLPFSAPSASPYSPLFPPAPPAPPPASPSPLFFYPLLSPSPLFYSIDPPLTGRGGSSRGGGDEGEPAGDARGGGAAAHGARAPHAGAGVCTQGGGGGVRGRGWGEGGDREGGMGCGREVGQQRMEHEHLMQELVCAHRGGEGGRGGGGEGMVWLEGEGMVWGGGEVLVWGGWEGMVWGGGEGLVWGGGEGMVWGGGEGLVWGGGEGLVWGGGEGMVWGGGEGMVWGGGEGMVFECTQKSTGSFCRSWYAYTKKGGRGGGSVRAHRGEGDGVRGAKGTGSGGRGGKGRVGWRRVALVQELVSKGTHGRKMKGLGAEEWWGGVQKSGGAGRRRKGQAEGEGGRLEHYAPQPSGAARLLSRLKSPPQSPPMLLPSPFEQNIMHRNHQEELAEAHRQRDAATGELRALQRQLEEEEEARAEAERRRVESERRRAAVEQERNESEMEASTLKQKLSRLQRQLSELSYARSKSGDQEERAVKEQAGKVAQLQEEVERLGKMEQEAERLRAEVMARDAKLKAEEAKITHFASKLREVTEVNETMERKLREQSAMEAAVYEVTAADTRKSGHVVRLRKKTAYSCAVCKLAGRGLCWRCTHSTCADYIHPQCLTKG